MSISLFVALFLPVELMAQAGVRSVTDTPQANTASTVEASAIYEIQELQQEVQSLRGLVEEQAYAIKRLKQQRLDDYLDLDKRVSELVRQQQAAASAQRSSVLATSAPSVLTGTGAESAIEDDSVTPSVVTNGASAVLGNNSQAANTLYSEGISLLLDKQDYSGAKGVFAEYLDRFKGGQYTPNVYYWTGQILFANGEKKAAADNFELLISEYGTHSKVPDAQFKLARIYFEQGKKGDAKIILDKVAASDTDAALLAKSFISKNY
jgi:tol-pal system protein YbgF